MKKVLVLGATGMLGSVVYDVLRHKHKLVLSVRNKSKINLLERKYGGTRKHKIVDFDAMLLYKDFLGKKEFPGAYLSKFLKKIGDVDYVINTIGITIPSSLDNPTATFFINSALPHILASIFGKKLIHITTDCAYNGQIGFPYDENSPKTAVDVYGLSKSIGEPETCLTLRTSLVGRELEGFTGLLEWFLKQEGKEVNGFSKHYWNGITTRQFAKICNQIIQNPKKYPQSGIYHIFSNPVSKYEMLLKFKEKFNVNCHIRKDSGPKLNRVLKTVKGLNKILKIPSFEEMVEEM